MAERIGFASTSKIPFSRSWGGGLAALSLWLVLLAGCTTQYVKLRTVPKSPLVEQLKLTSRWGPKPSPRVKQTVRLYDLEKELKYQPDEMFIKLREVIDQEPSAEKVYAFAELSYIAGKKHELVDKPRALEYFGTSVAYSYLYMFDERFAATRNPYDPQFRGACDLYNGALESCMRILKSRGELVPGRKLEVRSSGQSWDIAFVTRNSPYQAEEYEKFEFASDYEVQGLKNDYHGYGLGVPLIAVRKAGDSARQAEHYYPPRLSFPLTAFLRLLPDEQKNQTGPSHHRAVLELHDPLITRDIQLGNRLLPLENDLSTPLAYFLDDMNLDKFATSGLLRPDKDRQVQGIYMLQPYQPGKIPVLMVHGLWSSPVTWMEMFNDLRSVQQLRERYQFWFYLYPSGQPFWTSASQLREELAELRRTFDPQTGDPAFDQMVLVGHSMGGLVSKMQTLDSREDYWRLVSEQPYGTVPLDDETRHRLDGLLFFQPNPSIRRVITIGTPHRGSKFANEPARYLAQRLISLPRRSLILPQQLLQVNPSVAQNLENLETQTSLDSLAPESAILPVMLESPHLPGVRYHNIVGVMSKSDLLSRFSEKGDGVVGYDSAHLEHVDSEIVVDAEHTTVHQHPRSVLEVRRILLEHLRDLDTVPRGQYLPVTPVQGVETVGP